MWATNQLGKGEIVEVEGHTHYSVEELGILLQLLLYIITLELLCGDFLIEKIKFVTVYRFIAETVAAKLMCKLKRKRLKSSFFIKFI